MSSRKYPSRTSLTVALTKSRRLLAMVLVVPPCGGGGGDGGGSGGDNDTGNHINGGGNGIHASGDGDVDGMVVVEVVTVLVGLVDTMFEVQWKYWPLVKIQWFFKTDNLFTNTSKTKLVLSMYLQMNFF